MSTKAADIEENINPEEEKDELYEHFRFEVDKGTELIRIDKYLQNLIANTSRNKVQHDCNPHKR